MTLYIKSQDDFQNLVVGVEEKSKWNSEQSLPIALINWRKRKPWTIG